MRTCLPVPACQPVCLSVCQRAAHPAMATPSLPLPPSVSSSLVVPYFRRLIPVIWGHFRRNWAGKTDGRTERGRSTVVSNMHVVRRSLACMHSHPRFDQKGKQRETNQSIVRNLNNLSFSSIYQESSHSRNAGLFVISCVKGRRAEWKHDMDTSAKLGQNAQ